MGYTLWLCQNNYWKYHIEIVDFPIKHGGSFRRFLYVYKRVDGL
jgi:hypothetical protein